jgi:hypothetical protein
MTATSGSTELAGRIRSSFGDDGTTSEKGRGPSCGNKLFCRVMPGEENADKECQLVGKRCAM